MAYEGVDARASARPTVITAAFPAFWLAAVMASETATKHPRFRFQTFLKILFICFLQRKKKLKRFDQHRPSTALVETFEDWRKNLSLNAFFRSSACV